jgi:hypothetical protein
MGVNRVLQGADDAAGQGMGDGAAGAGDPEETGAQDLRPAEHAPRSFVISR